MWFYNDGIAINLKKATAIRIKQAGNQFKVYAMYIEDIHIEYVLQIFNTLKEAQDFIKEITNVLNGKSSDKLGYSFTW